MIGLRTVDESIKVAESLATFSINTIATVNNNNDIGYYNEALLYAVKLKMCKVHIVMENLINDGNKIDKIENWKQIFNLMDNVSEILF